MQHDRDMAPPSPRSAPAAGPLDALLRQAGATMVERHGRWVAARFGAVAGELAVCRQTVGLVDRSDCAVVELRGAPRAVDRLVCLVAGQEVSDATALQIGGAWWCRVTPERVIVQCEPGQGDAVCAELDRVNASGAGAPAVDLSDDYAAIGLVGPTAPALLRDVGLSPAQLFSNGMVGGVPAMVLHDDASRFEVIVARAYAKRIWKRLALAGHRFGAALVGVEALELLWAREHLGVDRSASLL